MEIEILPQDLDASYGDNRNCPLAKAIRRKFTLIDLKDVDVSGIYHSTEPFKGRGRAMIKGEEYTFSEYDWSYDIFIKLLNQRNFISHKINLVREKGDPLVDWR
jgi:hypothetical protein